VSELAPCLNSFETSVELEMPREIREGVWSGGRKSADYERNLEGVQLLLPRQLSLYYIHEVPWHRSRQ